MENKDVRSETIVKKLLLTALIGGSFSNPANAYLCIHLGEDGVQRLIAQRQEIIGKVDKLSSEEKAGLVEIQLYDTKKNRPVQAAGQVIDLIGDSEKIHQNFHMTLNDLDRSLTDPEIKQLVGAFSLIEFVVSGVNFMGQFITLEFSGYKLRDEKKTLTDEQSRLLSDVLPVRPHLSLYKAANREVVDNSRLDDEYGYVLSVPEQKLEDIKNGKIKEFNDLWDKLSKTQQKNSFIAGLKSKMLTALPGDIQYPEAALLKAFTKTSFISEMKRTMTYLLDPDKPSQASDARKILRMHYPLDGKAPEVVSGCAFKQDSFEGIITLLMDIFKVEPKEESKEFQSRIIAAAAEATVNVMIENGVAFNKVKPPKNSKLRLNPEKIAALFKALRDGFTGVTMQFDSDVSNKS
ncbi:MAG: hypothetical protein KF798_07305 [Candidatus Paracaedibacteraceae bacterium]|nr:hypothetical protein [Candidatus Paracaedibacteraceae bacterium]